jgi:hypothetical protein
MESAARNTKGNLKEASEFLEFLEDKVPAHALRFLSLFTNS